jgi:CBS domain-containing protein
MEVTGTVEALLSDKGRDVFGISPDKTVFEAIEQLSERNIGALLVMEEGHLIGVFSERDYTRKVALAGRNSRETRVREIITGRIVSVSPTTPVPECMRQMIENRVRHLPVLDGDQVVGVISIGDLVNFIMNAQRATIEQLHSYISGGYPG